MTQVPPTYTTELTILEFGAELTVRCSLPDRVSFIPFFRKQLRSDIRTAEARWECFSFCLSHGLDLMGLVMRPGRLQRHLTDDRPAVAC